MRTGSPLEGESNQLLLRRNNPMNTTNESTPTSRQLARLRRLVSRTQGVVPYLPIEHLDRDAVKAWSEYLSEVTSTKRGVEHMLAAIRQQSQQRATRPQAPASGECPPTYLQVLGEANHEHELECYVNEHKQEIIYCSVCELGMVGGITHHDTPVILATKREDDIDWPIWRCACGCRTWGRRW
jgi:hypothetical protein